MIRHAENVADRFLDERPELIRYQLLHIGLALVANASFFRVVFDIPIRILPNFLVLCLGCCNWRKCSLLDKMTFHNSWVMSLFVSSTTVWKDSGFITGRNAASRFGLCGKLWVPWEPAEGCGCLPELRRFELDNFHGHTSRSGDQCKTTVCYNVVLGGGL